MSCDRHPRLPFRSARSMRAAGKPSVVANSEASFSGQSSPCSDSTRGRFGLNSALVFASGTSSHTFSSVPPGSSTATGQSETSSTVKGSSPEASIGHADLSSWRGPWPTGELRTVWVPMITTSAYFSCQNWSRRGGLNPEPTAYKTHPPGRPWPLPATSSSTVIVLVATAAGLDASSWHKACHAPVRAL